MDRIPYVPQLHHSDDLPVIDCDDDYMNDLLALLTAGQADAQTPLPAEKA